MKNNTFLSVIAAMVFAGVGSLVFSTTDTGAAFNLLPDNWDTVCIVVGLALVLSLLATKVVHSAVWFFGGMAAFVVFMGDRYMDWGFSPLVQTIALMTAAVLLGVHAGNLYFGEAPTTGYTKRSSDGSAHVGGSTDHG